MNANDFEKLAFEVTGCEISLFLPEDPTCKYTSYRKFTGELQPNTKYGICIDRMIEYDFKTTTKVETFFKSFVNQHISKYELKKYRFEIVDGFVVKVKPTREDIVKKYTSDRVSKYHYYTTLYGIGMFAFFTKDIALATVKLAKYLEANGISYTNEYSDAGWAYRFVIGKTVEEHNELLKNFNLE